MLFLESKPTPLEAKFYARSKEPVMEETLGSQSPASSISKQVDELQDPAVQHTEDATQKTDTAPGEADAAPVSSPSTLKDSSESDTDKLKAVSRSPLVEERDTASTSYVQLEANAEDCEQTELALRKHSPSVEREFAELEINCETGRTLMQIHKNYQKVEKDFGDFLTEIEVIKNELKEMKETLTDVLPGYVAELSGEYNTADEQIGSTSQTTTDVPAEEERNEDFEEQIIARMEELKTKFKNMISNYGIKM